MQAQYYPPTGRPKELSKQILRSNDRFGLNQYLWWDSIFPATVFLPIAT